MLLLKTGLQEWICWYIVYAVGKGFNRIKLIRTIVQNLLFILCGCEQPLGVVSLKENTAQLGIFVNGNNTATYRGPEILNIWNILHRNAVSELLVSMCFEFLGLSWQICEWWLLVYFESTNVKMCLNSHVIFKWWISKFFS